MSAVASVASCKAWPAVVLVGGRLLSDEVGEVSPGDYGADARQAHSGRPQRRRPGGIGYRHPQVYEGYGALGNIYASSCDFICGRLSMSQPPVKLAAASSGR